MTVNNTGSIRERLISALEGGTPHPIPYVTYSDFFPQTMDENEDASIRAWQPLLDAGFGIWHFIYPLRTKWQDVEREVIRERSDGRTLETELLRTPVGTLRQVRLDGWTQEYFLKGPEDYRVAEYMVRHATVDFHPEDLDKSLQWLGDYGIPLIEIGRSPYQTILVDWAGLENFSYHLADGFPEFQGLMEAFEDLMLARARTAAQLPTRYVSLLENLTADQVGPRRFQKIHMAFYEKFLGILHGQGKKVFAHMDGKLANLAGLVAQTGFDGIDSLTEPPEGDMLLADARAAFPEMCLWANINIDLYNLPPADLRSVVRRMVNEGAPDGRKLIFEVSEDLPANWRESIPVVLEELAR